MRTTQIQMAAWAKAEEGREKWVAWRKEFFSKVRFTFILLLGVAIYVFADDHQLQIEVLASKDIHRMLNHVKLENKLKQKAMDYQSNVDTVSDFQQSSPPPGN